jgi:hypothetical protein
MWLDVVNCVAWGSIRCILNSQSVASRTTTDKSHGKEKKKKKQEHRTQNTEGVSHALALFPWKLETPETHNHTH